MFYLFVANKRVKYGWQEIDSYWMIENGVFWCKPRGQRYSIIFQFREMSGRFLPSKKISCKC